MALLEVCFYKVPYRFSLYCTFSVRFGSFGEAETQRTDIGQIASREHSRSRWKRGDWCAVIESVSKVWMDLLLDITVGKTFFLPFIPGSIAQIGLTIT